MRRRSVRHSSATVWLTRTCYSEHTFAPEPPPLNVAKPPATLSRLHGLDTLRAAAIPAVMIFHLQSALPTAIQPVGDIGWIGVDLFFVLSGFLIGSQLLKPFALGQRLDLPQFYLRRAYRILPAYLVVLLLYLAVPIWREKPGLPAPWKLLTFTANFGMDYPARLAFSHVWSLCVEEHFYLFWPLCILIVGWRRSFSVGIVLVVAVGVYRALTMRHFAEPVQAAGLLQHTEMRIDYIMMGCLIALAVALHPSVKLISGMVWLFRGICHPMPASAVAHTCRKSRP